jgi:hypothetical protein
MNSTCHSVFCCFVFFLTCVFVWPLLWMFVHVPCSHLIVCSRFFLIWEYLLFALAYTGVLPLFLLTCWCLFCVLAHISVFSSYPCLYVSLCSFVLAHMWVHVLYSCSHVRVYSLFLLSCEDSSVFDHMLVFVLWPCSCECLFSVLTQVWVLVLCTAHVYNMRVILLCPYECLLAVFAHMWVFFLCTLFTLFALYLLIHICMCMIHFLT